MHQQKIFLILCIPLITNCSVEMTSIKKNTKIEEKKTYKPLTREEVRNIKKSISDAQQHCRSLQPREMIKEQWRARIVEKQEAEKLKKRHEAKWLKFQQEVDRILLSGVLDSQKPVCDRMQSKK